jgi:DNA-binding response OmpR family regulator
MQSEPVTILLICEDEARLAARKKALKLAEFSLVSARSVAEGWAMSDYFDIAAVIIDHELAHDITAAALSQRYITWKL